MTSHFRVFGCPCIVKKWAISVYGKPEDNSRELREESGEYTLDFPPTQKGLLLYVPSTSQIVISGDVVCDKTFASTVAETWRPIS
jgi:hypothetical protein